MRAGSSVFRWRRSARAQALFLGLYVAVAALLSGALVLLRGPDELMILLVIPVVAAPLLWPRPVYLAMLLVAAALGLWVTSRLSSNFSGSLETISVLVVALLLATEIVRWFVVHLERLDRALAKSEARFRSLVQGASDVIAVLDAAGVVGYVSPAVARVLGYQPEEVTGRELLPLVHPEDAVWAEQLIRQATAQPIGPRTVELRLRHRDGSWRSLEATCTNLLADPSVGGIVVNARDVTERKRFEEELRRQAFHDALTGLPNRALLLDRIAHALARGGRSQDGLAVLLFDLDRFKLINDTLGHRAGDQALLAAAQRLQAGLRPADTVARLGGDQFAVLLEGIASLEGAAAVARRMLERLQAPLRLGERELFLSASVGIVVSVAETLRPEDLLRAADLAMHRAKAEGSGRYAVYEPALTTGLAGRLALETDLRRALERGELRLYYQPQVELASGRIVGAEALLRWAHPERGLLPPSEFVAIAEETGLIVPIGQWALSEACRAARRWQQLAGAGRDLTIGVNLSVRQFQQPDLVENIARVLAETGLEPAALELELTETILAHDLQEAASRLRALKQLGVRLAIDDFGTGYSSLGYLRTLPVDTLKIDRSFLGEPGSDERSVAVLRAITDLAAALGMDVTAEGIETIDQLERLRAVRCGRGQGYYFARPLSAERLPALLRASGAPPARDARAPDPGAGRAAAPAPAGDGPLS